jgi:hypothetical protein
MIGDDSKNLTNFFYFERHIASGVMYFRKKGDPYEPPKMFSQRKNPYCELLQNVM